MQAAIDRVMQTYGMMVNLSPGQEAEAWSAPLEPDRLKLVI